MKLTFNKQILLGALLGVCGGIFLNRLGPAHSLYSPTVYASTLIGKGIFLNLLKMIIIPLVFTSIVVGIANLRAHAQMDKVWKITILYFLTTTGFAILLGLLVVNIFKPGVGLEIGMFRDVMGEVAVQSMGVSEYLKVKVFELFANPFQAMAHGEILPTIIFAVFLGIALVAIGEQKAVVFLNVLNELFSLLMIIIGWIMKILPLGLMALLIEMFASVDASILKTLAKFMVLVIGVTLFHGMVVLPSLLYALTKRNPITFLSGVREALVTAFSTSSSSATLPVTMKCAEKNLNVDKGVAGFVLPLGATMNMDGTALYEAVAAIFIANLVGIDLNAVQQVIIFITAMIAAIGAPPGSPQRGLSP